MQYDALKRVSEQEEVNRQKMIDALRDKVILFTGRLEAKDVFGQDAFEMEESHDFLTDERLVVTSVFMSKERFDGKQTPIIYATREHSYLEHRAGGRVSFRPLQARKIEIVE